MQKSLLWEQPQPCDQVGEEDSAERLCMHCMLRAQRKHCDELQTETPFEQLGQIPLRSTVGKTFWSQAPKHATNALRVAALGLLSSMKASKQAGEQWFSLQWKPQSCHLLVSPAGGAGWHEPPASAAARVWHAFAQNAAFVNVCACLFCALHPSLLPWFVRLYVRLRSLPVACST